MTSVGPRSLEGVVTLMEVGDAITTPSARLRPKRTSAVVEPGEKPDPTMVIWSPPFVDPLSGSRRVTVTGPPFLSQAMVDKQTDKPTMANATYAVLREGRVMWTR